MTAPGQRRASTRRVAVRRSDGRRERDTLAVEEPLEVRLGTRSLLVTMRTPGRDFDLVRGLLYTEGLAAEPGDVTAVAYCRGVPKAARGNVVTVALRRGARLAEEGALRVGLVSSACGVCGKSTLEAVRVSAPRVAPGPTVPRTVLAALPDTLRRGQAVFRSTGGLHAAGLFRPDGRLLALAEDVGRHNAVDKIVGEALRFGRLPLSNTLLLVSGRAGFEIVQKARRAGIPILCSVSAPSSLAVSLAKDGRQTLIGFLREGRFNVYCGDERVLAC
ncbi:MAG: formate dehydrogenase accessory sulfurtransferase FdhD [Planctomycetota bacterium]